MSSCQKHFWFHEEEGIVVSLEYECGQVAGVSQRYPASTAINEDSAGVFVCGDRAMVLAVADGMGGANWGDRASRTVIEQIAAQVEKTSEVDGLRTAILDGIEAANEEILGWGQGAGATLVAGLFIDDTIRVFHVGDAEGLLSSNRGRIKYSTVAHTPVAMAVEIGVLGEREAMHHDERNIVSNHVGSREMRIEIGPAIRMGVHDTFLLGSDGLFDNLMTGEIAEIVRSRKLAQRAEELLEMTRKRMLASDANQPSKPDDLTFLLLRRKRPTSSG